MKTKKCFYIMLTFLSVILALDAKSQELPQWIQNPLCGQNSSPNGYKTKFLDINIGYAAISYFGNSTNNYLFLKTNNGGVNWTSVWSMQSAYFPCFTFDIVNENVICIYANNSIYMTWNGGQSWAKRLDFNILGLYSKKNSCVKFFNESVGYATYIPGNIDNSSYPTFYIFKTTDGGHNWFTIYQYLCNISRSP